MKFVFVCSSNPWARTHGGTLRTREMTAAIAAMGHEVICAYPEQDGAAPIDSGVTWIPVGSVSLGDRNIPPFVRAVKRALVPMPTTVGARNAKMSELLQSIENVDYLVVNRIVEAQYITDVPGAKLWTDYFDLFSEFATTEAAKRSGMSRIGAEVQKRALIRQENEVTASAACVTAVGYSDAQELQRRTKCNVEWLPVALAVPAAEVRQPSGPSVGGFLANFAFGPNVDAMNAFVEFWWPKFQELNIDFVVAGHGSELLDMPDGIKVLGEVGAVSEFYENVNFTVAPIRIGGGMKVKIVESLLYGRPVVATPFSLEGFPPELRAAVGTVDLESSAVGEFLTTVAAKSFTDQALLSPFTHAGFRSQLALIVGKLP